MWKNNLVWSLTLVKRLSLLRQEVSLMNNSCRTSTSASLTANPKQLRWCYFLQINSCKLNYYFSMQVNTHVSVLLCIYRRKWWIFWSRHDLQKVWEARSVMSSCLLPSKCLLHTHPILLYQYKFQIPHTLSVCVYI